MRSATKERILVVDDEPQVLVALEDLLGDQFTVLTTGSADDALEVMGRETDIAVVISDQRMPRMQGDELLSRLRTSSDAERILITGFADLSAVIRAVNDGKIFAYVTKPWNAEDLQLKVRTAVDHFRLAKELTQERQRLQRQTHLLNSILDSMAEGVIAIGRSGELLLFNRRAGEVLGIHPRGATMPPNWMKACGLCDRDGKTPLERDRDPLLRAMKGESSPEVELFVRRAPVGTGVTVAVATTPLLDHDGKLAGGIALFRDVTRQRVLEQQLAHSQKMDAIGRLAGGVAHDFNNLLAVIMSYAGLLLEEITEPSNRADLEELNAAARRAAALTSQLLTFSRPQAIQARTIELNELVRDLEKMLKRVISEDIELVSTLAPNLWAVRADVSQVEQIIVNLAVNARDAMPKGGKLEIETANVTVRGSDMSAHPGAAIGDFVMLAVSDTGTGMDEETKRRIFEPFFTTKAVGTGTGLGLSTVYGIVRQSGGHIVVDSQVGRGTCFRIYMPRVHDVAEPASLRSQAPSRLLGDETILLVEDDDAVRRVTSRILTHLGYTVLDARRAGDARRLSAEHGARIGLLLTDVVMPEITGPELARELCTLNPGMRVIYMSGYTGSVLADPSTLEPGIAYLEKPFSPASLAAKVREALNTSA
jgi:signal transduction histidine kinase/response regulator RpfG family c-di-GMP phosphodiesterase